MRTFSVIVVSSLVWISSTLAFAGESVFGGTNFTSTDSNRASSSAYGVGDSDRDAKKKWLLKMGLGAGISRLESSGIRGDEPKLNASNFQLVLSGRFERLVAGPLAFETGGSLALQFMSAPPRGDTQFVPRYFDIPALARLYFGSDFSLGFGGFGTVPLSNPQGTPRSEQLPTVNIGLLASAQYKLRISRQASWVFELLMQRGLEHIGDAGVDPNHIRNLTALIGMATAF